MGCLIIHNTLVLTLISLVSGQSESITVNNRYCIPNCELPAAGRRYCQTVLEAASCRQDVTRYLYTLDKSDEKLPFACGCFWEHSLRSITGQMTEEKSLKTCLLLTSLLCARFSGKNGFSHISSSTMPSGANVSKSHIKHLQKQLAKLLTLQKQILQQPDGKNKQLAEAAIIPKINKVQELLRKARLQLGEHPNPKQDKTVIINGHVDKKGSTKTTELNKEEVKKVTAKEGWNYMSDDLKKKLNHEEHIKQRDRQWKFLLSLSCVCTIIILLILALLAKAKGDKKDAVDMDSVGDLDLGLQRDVKITCWDTFLEKLRNHYKQREEEDLLKQSRSYGSTGGSMSNRTGTKANQKSPNITKLHNELPDIKVTDFGELSDCEEEETIFQTKLIKNQSPVVSIKSTEASSSVEDHVIHHS